MTAVARPRESIARAAVWMAGTVFSFIALAIAGRAAARHVSTAEILLVRSLVTTTVAPLLAILVTGSLACLVTRRPGLHLLRNIAQFGGQFLWLYGLPLIPLAQVFSLEFTAPLWVAVLAPLVLGERMTWMRAGVATLGFLGVMVVLRPGVETMSIGSVSVLASALGFALSMLMTKILSRTEHPLAVLFYMGVLQIPIALALSWQGIAWPPVEAYLPLVVIAFAAMAAHYSIMRALSHADTVIVAPLDFLRVPLIALVGAFLYGEPFEPLVLAGAAVILLANFLSIWNERRREAAAAATAA